MTFAKRSLQRAFHWAGVLVTLLALAACGSNSDETAADLTPKAVQSFVGTVSCDTTAGAAAPVAMQTRVIFDRGIIRGMTPQPTSATAVQLGGLAGSLVSTSRSQIAATIAGGALAFSTQVDFRVVVPGNAFDESGRWLVGIDSDGNTTLQGGSTATIGANQRATCNWNLAAAAPPRGPVSYDRIAQWLTPPAITAVFPDPTTAAKASAAPGNPGRKAGLLGGGDGCGGVFGIVSDGLWVGSAILAIPTGGASFAAVLATGAVASGAAGSAAGNACLTGELNAITEQLAIQAAQIQQIDSYLALASNVFFFAWFQNEVQNTTSSAYIWNFNLNGIAPQGSAKGLFGNWMDPDGLGLWTYNLSPAPNAPTTPAQLALNDTAYTNARIQVVSNGSAFQGYLKQLSGTDVITPNGSGCTQPPGCAAQVVQVPNSALLLLYKDLFKTLTTDINMAVAPDQQFGVTNYQNSNVVPLYDQYNQMLVKFWMQSLYALQEAQAMEWLVNQLNYYRATSSTSMKALPPIPSWGGVAQTYYAYGGGSLQDETNAYNTAQINLAKVYAARMNQLYLNTLNYIVSDVPVSPQAYPIVPVSWSYNGKTYTEKAPIDYAGEVGKNISAPTDGSQGRTPLSLIPAAARPQGAPWLSATVLYQFSGINDVATCANTLQAYLASTTGGTVPGWLQTPGACPSIFTLPNGSPVSYNCDTASPPNCSGSVYDGNTLTPYTSFQAATGATGGPLVLSAALVNNLKFCDPDSPGLVWESHRPGPRLNCGRWYAPAYLGKSFPRANPPAANGNQNYYNGTMYAAQFLFIQKPGRNGNLTFNGSNYPAITSIMGSWPAGTPDSCNLIPSVPAVQGAPDTGTPIKNNVRTLLGTYHTGNTTQGCSIGWLGEGLGSLPLMDITTYTSQDEIRFAPRLPRAVNASNNLGGFPLPLTIYAGQSESNAGFYSVRVRQGDLATEGYQCSPLPDLAFTCMIIDGSTYTVSMQGFGEGSTALNFLLTQAP